MGLNTITIVTIAIVIRYFGLLTIEIVLVIIAGKQTWNLISRYFE